MRGCRHRNRPDPSTHMPQPWPERGDLRTASAYPSYRHDELERESFPRHLRRASARESSVPRCGDGVRYSLSHPTTALEHRTPARASRTRLSWRTTLDRPTRRVPEPLRVRGGTSLDGDLDHSGASEAPAVAVERDDRDHPCGSGGVQLGLKAAASN